MFCPLLGRYHRHQGRPFVHRHLDFGPDFDLDRQGLVPYRLDLVVGHHLGLDCIFGAASGVLLPVVASIFGASVVGVGSSPPQASRAINKYINTSNL